MLTYIIEDSSLKADILKKFLASSFPELVVKIQASFQSGLKAVQATPPGIILLDMTLPTFDRLPNSREGRLRPLGGYDMMRKIKLRGIKTQIIVVTQLESFGEKDEEASFSEITTRCLKEFSDIFVGSVYFDQREAAWQDSLDQLIRRILPGVINC